MHLPGLLRDVMDFCYPGRCAACDADCDGGAVVCPPCAAALHELESAAACGRCGMPLAEADAPCPYCLGDGLRPYAAVLRLGTFRDPLKHLVHQMKYHRRWSLGEDLARRLLARPPVRNLLADADGILPVPLHRLRQIARGYNQAEVVARALVGGMRRRVRPPILRAVVRLRNTETQTHLHSHAKRVENLRDAFALLDPRAVRGRHVVVVDDVMTTGATLQALARALRPAKPARLSAIVVAVADPKGRDFQRI